MKKIAILVAILLCMVPCSIAENADIDFSSMETNDLVELMNDITNELSTRPDWSTDSFIFPNGTYEIGKDLVPGSYEITAIITDASSGQNSFYILVYETEEELNAHDATSLIELREDGDKAHLRVSEGEYIIVESTAMDGFISRSQSPFILK